MRKKKLRHFTGNHYKIEHPKLKTIHQQDILRCFSYDYTASKASELVGMDITTINRYYSWLREIIAENYQHFMRFQQYDINYELTLFLSHSAMATMFWLDIDNIEQWDSHTVLLQGEKSYQQKSTSELMKLKLDDAGQQKRYQEHIDRNYVWLTESFINHRIKHLRTALHDNPEHASETIYRFLIASHVLLRKNIDEDIASEVKGRFIGEDDTLKKVGTLNIDKVFEELFFKRYNTTISGIIFSDLIDWCMKNPDA